MKKYKKIIIIVVAVVLALAIIFGAVVIYKNVTALKSNVISSAQPVNITLPKPNTILLDEYPEHFFARNPWDMQVYDGKVYICSGDYDKNPGSAKIICYNPKDGSFTKCDNLYSEQATRFFVINDFLYTVSVDPVTWGVGEFYKLGKESNQDFFFDYFSLLKSNIHCFDMIEYDGYLFFGGQVLDDQNFSMVQTVKLEEVEADNVQKVNQIPFYKNGEQITEQYALFTVFELFEFKGKLYAWHTNSESFYPGLKGLYLYDKEKARFDYVAEEFTLEPVVERQTNNIDYDHIQAEVTYDGKLVFANNGLFYTSDLKDYTECSFGEGYEGFIAHDLLEIDGQLYVLASKEQKNGKFKTCVFVTEDLKEFKEVLNFESDSYMISFEYIDKTFIFGEGGVRDNTPESCGNLYAVKVE